MNDHTPGPWFRTPSVPSDGFECFWITACSASNQEREIATVSGPQNDTNGANACLIAAAPKLLAAAKEAKKFLEPNLSEPGRTVFWRLVAAISEAEDGS